MTSRGDSSARFKLAWPAALALALSALAMSAAEAAPAKAKATRLRLTVDSIAPFEPTLTSTDTFSFTAPGRAIGRQQAAGGSFTFTPSGKPERAKSLSLGMSTRVVASAADTGRATGTSDVQVARPTAYNVDLSVGWRGFAVVGGYSRVENGFASAVPLGHHETVDLGLSYRGKGWKTSLTAAQEQGTALMLTPIAPRYSVELGGALSLSPRLSVTGGVRYKLAPDTPSLFDPSRPDQAVYFGTSYAF
jgi:hypothetical protein